MSPYDIAKPPTKFTKFGEQVCIDQTHNAVEFHRAPTKSVRDIHFGKFLLLGKVNQSSPKSLLTLLRTTAPQCAKFHSAGPNDVGLVLGLQQKR